jgi:hypothetical protein
VKHDLKGVLKYIGVKIWTPIQTETGTLAIRPVVAAILARPSSVIDPKKYLGRNPLQTVTNIID